MMTHILSKPGFRLETVDEIVIRVILEWQICDICKMRESEVCAYMENISDMYLDDEEYDEDLKEMLDDAFPNDYDDLDERSKINYLLDTPCGSAFTTETNYDGEI